MTSALVAGATGFIGTNLVHALLRAGVTTYGLVREGARHRRRVEALEGFRGIPIGNYESAELERALRTIEVDVIYSVLGSGTSHAEDRWEVLVDSNIRAATDVARFAGGRARRLVHVGTCLEYAPKAGAIVESDPVGPSTRYAATKAAADLLVTHLCRDGGLEHAHARLFNTYGTFEGENRLVPFVLRHLRSGEPAALTAGTHVRDFTFVADVAEALRLLGDCPLPGGRGVFNVCSGRGIPVREVAETVADVTGLPRELLRFGARPERREEPPSIIGSHDALREATGWRPVVSLQSGIALVASGLTPPEAG